MKFAFYLFTCLLIGIHAGAGPCQRSLEGMGRPAWFAEKYQSMVEITKKQLKGVILKDVHVAILYKNSWNLQVEVVDGIVRIQPGESTGYGMAEHTETSFWIEPLSEGKKADGIYREEIIVDPENIISIRASLGNAEYVLVHE